MKKLIFVTCFLGLLGCSDKSNNLVTLNSDQRQCSGFEMRSPMKPYFWSGRFPIIFKTDVSFPAEYASQVQIAMDIWNTQFNKNLFELETGSRAQGVGPQRNGINSIILIPEWELEMDRQASTYTHYDNNNIREADIIINDEHQLSKSFVQPNEVDLVSLIVHELGHVLGLRHVDDNSSAMASGLPLGYSHRELSESDVANVLCMYKLDTE